jgi:hypothetical protein
MMNTKLGFSSFEGQQAKENTIKKKEIQPSSQAAFSKSSFKDPIKDKSYENLYNIRQRLEKLLDLDESEWTADDKVLISSLNKL